MKNKLLIKFKDQNSILPEWEKERSRIERKEARRKIFHYWEKREKSNKELLFFYEIVAIVGCQRCHSAVAKLSKVLRIATLMWMTF